MSADDAAAADPADDAAAADFDDPQSPKPPASDVRANISELVRSSKDPAQAAPAVTAEAAEEAAEAAEEAAEAAEEAAVVEDAIAQAEEAFDTADQDWSGELEFSTFFNAFRNNPAFLSKIATAVDVSVEELASMDDWNLEQLFQDLDTDYSGTISFEEFAKGVVEIRLARHQTGDANEDFDESCALQDAAEDAMDAFEDADWGYEGELTLEAFFQALQDEAVLQKISYATKIDAGFFQSLSQEQVAGFFQSVDTDASGTVSFSEWVTALVNMRKQTFAAEKQQEASSKRKTVILAEEAANLAELAFDDEVEFEGEFSFDQFLDAFRNNRDFVRKVAKVTGVPVDDLMKAHEFDLESLFQSLDTDYSGTVSFDEFVEGLVQIRVARHYVQKDEDAFDQECALQDAAEEAMDAFQDADFGFSGELTLEAFYEAMKDPSVLDKISYATKIDQEYFEGLSEEKIQVFFEHVDTDKSGTVSFNEWVTALVNIRQATYAQEKQAEEEDRAAAEREAEMHEEQQAAAEEMAVWEASIEAEEAFMGTDWGYDGELSLNAFFDAMKDVVILERIALATKIPVAFLQSLDGGEIYNFFQSVDTDGSGTVSFGEWVCALVKLRRDRFKEQIAEEALQAQKAAAEAGAAFDEGDMDEWSEEYTLEQFMDAFRTNERFVQRVARAANVDLEGIISMSDEDLQGFFAHLDTDFSGTISLDEFVTGLVNIRLQRLAAEKEQALLSPRTGGPAILLNLPPLAEEDACLVEMLYAPYDREGEGLKVEKVAQLLQDLGMLADVKTALEYASSTFGPANLDRAFDLEECTTIFACALAAQPLARPAYPTLGAARQKESVLRDVCGQDGVSEQDFPSVLGQLGIPDPDDAGHTRWAEHCPRDAGPVRFQEAVDLCNAALARASGHLAAQRAGTMTRCSSMPSLRSKPTRKAAWSKEKKASWTAAPRRLRKSTSTASLTRA